MAYPSCAPPPDGIPNPSCQPQAMCADKPKDQCSSDNDCVKGLHCQPEFVCIQAPCNAPLVCR